MDNKKKIIIGIVFLLVVAIIFLIIAIVNKPDNEEFKIEGIDLPQNKEVLKDTTIGDIKITNVSLLTSNGISTYKARVYNTSNDDLIIKKLAVVFEEDDIKNNVEVLRDAKIASGEFTYINITSEKDLSNIDKIEYVLE